MIQKIEILWTNNMDYVTDLINTILIAALGVVLFLVLAWIFI